MIPFDLIKSYVSHDRSFFFRKNFALSRSKY